jgi:hypothetical protein
MHHDHLPTDMGACPEPVDGISLSWERNPGYARGVRLDGNDPFFHTWVIHNSSRSIKRCNRNSNVAFAWPLVDMWHRCNSHSAREAKVPESSTLIGTLKDLPLKAVPFVIFLAASAVFGELLLRIPATPTLAQLLMSWVLAVFTAASGVLFFTKCFFGLAPNARAGFGLKTEGGRRIEGNARGI